MDKKNKLNILKETHDDIDDVAADIQVNGLYPGIFFSWTAKVAHKFLGVIFIYKEDITGKYVAFNPYAYIKIKDKKTGNILFLKKYQYIKIFFFR